MKKILIALLLLLLNINLLGQLPYTWVSNPGWVSSNTSVNTLCYQNGCYKKVSTSDCIGSSWNTYNNNQITSYTSPNYSFVCASNINVSINLDINLESRYDWLYFQYSIDGGISWVNPVSLSPSTNLSNVNLSGYSPLLIAGTSNNTNGWTGSIPTFTVTYSIPSSTLTKFRFIFESDFSINSYSSGSSGSFIYYADILGFSATCTSVLPIELVSFDGYKYDDYNLLTWVSANELNNDYYRLEKSTDALSWETAYIADGSGTSYTPIHYQYKDYNYKTSEIIYYRLIQVDLNGNSEIFNIVSIDRTHNKSERKLVKVTNILGQEVDPETNGVLIYQYSDGSYDKNYKIK